MPFIISSAAHRRRLSSLSSRGKSGMSDDTEIFKHVMQKRIGNADYWREIVILEEGPFVFRVVQQLQLGRIDSAGTLPAVRPSASNRFEWICPSKEAATEQALRCLQQSKNDNWLFPSSASSAA
jgi:hypothetical protein